MSEWYIRTEMRNAFIVSSFSLRVVRVLKDSSSLLENVLSKSPFVALLTMKWLTCLMCRGYWSTAEWPYYWLYPFYMAPLKFVIVRSLKLTAAENEVIVSWMWIKLRVNSEPLWELTIAGCSVLISVNSTCVYVCVSTHVRFHGRCYKHLLSALLKCNI